MANAASPKICLPLSCHDMDKAGSNFYHHSYFPGLFDPHYGHRISLFFFNYISPLGIYYVHFKTVVE